MRLALTLVAALVAAAPIVPEARAATPDLAVYHVGNSVTDTLNYTGLGQLVAQANGGYAYGRHIIPGAPLEWTWNHPNDGFTEAPYGSYSTALPNHTWNAVTLQPFDRQLTQPDGWGDRETIARYVNLAVQNPANKATQFYVYSRWPRREDQAGGGFKPFDFRAKWDRTYTGGWDNTNETRDYFKKLLAGVRTDAAGKLDKQVRLVPVGDVLYELDKRAKAGQITGLTSVEQLYGDGIHFGNLGSFVVGSTFFATLYKQSPVGQAVPAAWLTINAQYTSGGNFDLPGMADDPAYPNFDAASLRAVQQTIWDVVSTHADAGVAPSAPEPGAATAVGGLLSPALNRRRKVAKDGSNIVRRVADCGA